MTVGELLDRISSEEITEWHVFFDMQEQELERSRRGAEGGPEQRKPALGDDQARDAITEARKAQGLE